MDVVLRIVKYLKKQPGQDLLLASNKDETILAYCDVN